MSVSETSCQRYYSTHPYPKATRGIRDDPRPIHHIHPGLAEEGIAHREHLKAVHVIPVGESVIIVLFILQQGQMDARATWGHWKKGGGGKG